MTTGLVSILTNILDRYELTIRCIGQALENCGYTPTEFLCCDNGSTDQRVVDYIKSLHPAYLRQNTVNEGWAKGNNQMLYRANGEYICLLDNDMELPEGWLRVLVEHCQAIPETGVVSIYHGGTKTHSEQRHGRTIWRENPLGVKLFHRRVLERIGFFEEHCGLIYFADIYFNVRAEAAGFINYYVDGIEGHNIDCYFPAPDWYQQIKQDSLKAERPVAKTGYVPGPGPR